MKPFFKIHARNRHAFTLIELLIVITVATIIVGGILAPIGTMQRHGGIAQHAAQRAADQMRLALEWRRDVSLAQRVEIEPEGTVMRLERTGEAGELLSVRYSLTPVGEARREVTGGDQPASARHSAGLATLRFTREGAGYALRMTSSWDDGIAIQTGPERTFFATPLVGTAVAATGATQP